MNGPLLRIEVAASEVLGGPAIAWVEANQIIGLVARGEPGTFLRTALLPRFRRLEAAFEGDAGGETVGLPPVVSDIADAMQEVHDLLWRENQLGSAAWAEALAFALVGEKLYFLAAGECAAHSVHRGRVYPLTPSAAGAAGLGRGQKARIEITSMEIAGGQKIILVAAGARPDELAIAQLFGERLDLQRACDGLLPLTAGTDGGAGVVAISFVPIAQSEEAVPGGVFPRDIVEELENALAAGVAEFPVYAEDPAAAIEEAAEAAMMAQMMTPPDREPPPVDREPAPARVVVPYRVPPEEIPEPASNVVSFLDPLGNIDAKPAAPAATYAAESAAFAAGAAPRRRRPLVEARRPRPLPLAIGVFAGLIGIGSVLFGLAGPARTGAAARWNQMMHVLSGGPKHAAAAPETYLAVRSDPVGGTVFIDGKPVPGKTPLSPIAVAAGTHRVAVEIAQLGRWERTIEVKKGAGLHLNAAVVGALRVSLRDTTRVVELRLDGKRIGRAPLVLHDVPVGEHTLEAFGTGLGPWQRPVTVTALDTMRVTVGYSEADNFAVLSVSSSRLAEGGYQPSRGEAVYVDREPVGTTPVEDELEPGLHSVRVERRDEPPWIEILDVRAGGTYFVRAEFGVDRSLRIEHFPQESLASEGPVIVSAAVTGDPEEVTLYFQEGEGMEKGAVSMTRIRQGEPLFVAALPRTVLESGSVRYYIRARDRLAQDGYSEVYDIDFDSPTRTARRP